jgi:DNA-binding GntR family transcriptional regulator
MSVTRLSAARAAAKKQPKRAGVGRPRGTGAAMVFERLRERILNLELAPHADIDELTLVKEFKISRTPVREALIRLASEGLVELLPNKGPRVCSLDAKDVPVILEALDLAQRTVTKWAALRRTAANLLEIEARCDEFSRKVRNNDAVGMSEANKSFHTAIGHACGNEHLESWYESLLNASMRLARAAYTGAPMHSKAYKDYYARVDAEHRQMVAAIQQRDAEQAEKLARQHTMLFRERVVVYLTDSKADEIKV